MQGMSFSVRILFVGALTFWSGLFCAAQSSIDSLDLLLGKTEDRTQKLELNLQLAKEWIIKNTDSAWIYMEQALEISQSYELEEGEIEALNMKGNILQRQSYENEALIVYEQAIAKAEALDYKKGLAKLYNNVALIHTQRGEYPEALEGFTEATRYEEETQNREGMAQGLNNMGVVFYYQGDYDKAMDYFLESVRVHESMGNMLSAKQGYNNIGAINEALERYSKALEFYLRSLEIAINLGDKAEIGQSYNNIAGVYSNLEDWSKSEQYYLKAIEVNAANDDFYSLALNYLNLADMYPKSGQMDRSEPLFQKAQALVEEYSYKNLALDLFNKAAAFYAKSKDYKEAYAYQALYDAYKDSVYDEAKAKAIAETEALYETEKKEREAAEAKAALAQEQLKVERQNAWLILLAAGVFLIVFAAISIFRQQAARRRQVETEAALQEERTRAEGRRKLEEERQRISRDLHDHIGSQLTIISSQIDKLAFKELVEERRLRFEQISDHTRDTMAQLRETIWAMNNDEINLAMLAAKLQDFMQRSHQEGRQLKVRHEASADIVLSPEQTINLFRICQEAVQNAIKYAQFKMLEIHFKAEDDQLHVSISDDGKGMGSDSIQKGYGLRNMEARMEQINGSFQLNSYPGKGTQIVLKLPLNTPIAL